MRDDKDGVKKLTALITMVYEATEDYGKEPEQIESAVKFFRFVLEDYAYDDIRKAIKKFCKRDRRRPMPADIIQLIERGNKPPLDRAIYQAIKGGDAMIRTDEEWQYIRDYEKFAMKGVY